MKHRACRFATVAVAATLVLIGAPAAPAASGVFRVTSDSVDNDLRAGLDTLFWEHGGALVRYVDNGARDYVTVRPATDVISSAQVGTKLYFATAYDVWVTDGTADGPANLLSLPAWKWGSTIQGLRELNGNLLFAVDTPDEGWEPWSSNGTTSGTAIVKDIFPGYNYGFYYPGDVANLGGYAYFNGDDGVNGEELWASNGTLGGTSMIANIKPGAAGSGPHSFVACGSYVYFVADDGVNGYELWRTSGTAGTTLMVADLHTGAEGSGILEPTCVGTRLFLWASNTPSGNDELWVYDPGDNPSSRLLKGEWGCDPLTTFYCGPDTHTFRSVNGRLLFAAADGTHGLELWKSDGTPEGTVIVKDLWPGLNYSAGTPFPNTSAPYDMVEKDGKLYFRATHPDFGGEVWVSDGTAENTWPITDVLPGPKSAWPDQLTSAGRFVFFRVTGDGSYNVWGFDPTDTVPYRDLARDGSFEGANTGANWTLLGLTPLLDKRVCNERSLERCSFRIAGSATAAKGLRQTLVSNGVDRGAAGQMISLSGWSKAVGAAAHGGFYGLEIVVSYIDGTKQSKRVAFTRATHPWQYRRVAFKAAKEWDRVAIYARYLNQAGTAWFDDVRLTVR